MDVQAGTINVNDLCGFWTNEKHVNFLNWMEDSFVRTMLENDNNRSSSLLTYATGRVAPLDRYLPDSSESTRDLRHHKYTTTSSTQMHFSVPTDQNVTSSVITDEMRMTCRSSQPYDASEDQVVPQLGKIKGDKEEEEEENDRLEVGVPPKDNKNNSHR